DSGKRSSMGGTGRALAEQHFGWSRVASDILSVWG
ncbi:MAG: hypothetical protein K0R39_5121, partial [Symbiobacteriaceae bacterium]|nr:hypothetical protein [Symbiobacteriaceae bacterium]